MTSTVSFDLRVVTRASSAPSPAPTPTFGPSTAALTSSLSGPLFRLVGSASSILALAWLATPRHLIATASVLFAATLGALILSVIVGLVGFTASTIGPRSNQAIAVEAAAIVAGALLAVTLRHQPTTQEVLP
jgi:hypothetical protein